MFLEKCQMPPVKRLKNVPETIPVIMYKKADNVSEDVACLANQNSRGKKGPWVA